MTTPTLAERLFAVFVVELEEQVALFARALEDVDSDPANAERITTMYRVSHTLKGAARASTQPLIEQVCRTVEEMLLGVRNSGKGLTPSEVKLLLATRDALADARDRLQERRELAGSPLAKLHTAIDRGEYA